MDLKKAQSKLKIEEKDKKSVRITSKNSSQKIYDARNLKNFSIKSHSVKSGKTQNKAKNLPFRKAIKKNSIKIGSKDAKKIRKLIASKKSKKSQQDKISLDRMSSLVSPSPIRIWVPPIVLSKSPKRESDAKRIR